jgi:hypothetical protein
MSFTRFHDDTSRIEDQLKQSTYTGRYLLNTPGPGLDLHFWEDPHLRLQKWGANLRTNRVNLESSLRNLYTPLNRDTTQYDEKVPQSTAINYKTKNPSVQESRATHPAWMFKDLEQTRWEEPFINPQGHTEIAFPYNVNSKQEAKDEYIREF